MKLNLVGRVRSVKENGTECCSAHLDFQSPREREKTPLLFITGESWITVSISTFIFYLFIIIRSKNKGIRHDNCFWNMTDLEANDRTKI